MVTGGRCEKGYPWPTILVSSLVALLLYGLGAYIFFRVGWPYMAVYLAAVAALEVRLLGGHCVDCYYYGRACAFGRGKLTAVLFERGDPERFCARAVTWRSMVPDMLVAVAPVIAGIVLLILEFSWALLAALVVAALLATAGNGAVRGSLACGRCAQRELGCPAEELFRKKSEARAG